MPALPYVTPFTNQTVAQVLLRYLALEGVDKVFGPGTALVEIVDFLRLRGSRTRV